MSNNKKIPAKKKLLLNRETLRALTPDQLKRVGGGASDECTRSNYFSCICTIVTKPAY